MQGEIPLPDAYGNFKEASTRAPQSALMPTPYTALHIDRGTRERLMAIAGTPAYEKIEGKYIPLCWNGDGLEPFEPDTVEAKAIVDDGEGLQIMLCHINGRDIGKSGVPYHMIWSTTHHLAGKMVADEDYTWQVTELQDNTEGFLKANEPLFRTVVKDVPYRRVLRLADMQAERLAKRAYQDFKPQPFERIVGVKAPNMNYWTRPQFVIVTEDNSQGRQALWTDYNF